jgi:hypothetical protein
MSGLYTAIRIVLTIMGVLMVLSGILWTLQGAGIVMWPASSFMLKQPIWITYGTLLANFGLLQLYIVHRR